MSWGKKSTLKNEGAVSAKCAKEMAKGGAKAAETDVCLSVTGLAGPGGGTEETPVGTVFMGCCCAGKLLQENSILQATEAASEVRPLLRR